MVFWTDDSMNILLLIIYGQRTDCAIGLCRLTASLPLMLTEKLLFCSSPSRSPGAYMYQHASHFSDESVMDNQILLNVKRKRKSGWYNSASFSTWTLCPHPPNHPNYCRFQMWGSCFGGQFTLETETSWDPKVHWEEKKERLTCILWWYSHKFCDYSLLGIARHAAIAQYFSTLSN